VRKITKLKALLKGDVSINYIDKIWVIKTPGDTTMDAAHQ